MGSEFELAAVVSGYRHGAVAAIKWLCHSPANTARAETMLCRLLLLLLLLLAKC